MKIYAYEKCGTCRKALNWLDDNGAMYEVIPIRETPPSKREIECMLESVDGNVRKLFNTSGADYKSLNMKERLPEMSEEEVIDILSQHGNLIKRPFLVADETYLVGFNEEDWQEALGMFLLR